MTLDKKSMNLRKSYSVITIITSTRSKVSKYKVFQVKYIYCRSKAVLLLWILYVIARPLGLRYKQYVSPSVRKQLVKMLKTLEPHGIL